VPGLSDQHPQLTASGCEVLRIAAPHVAGAAADAAATTAAAPYMLCSVRLAQMTQVSSAHTALTPCPLRSAMTAFVSMRQARHHGSSMHARQPCGSGSGEEAVVRRDRDMQLPLSLKQMPGAQAAALYCHMQRVQTSAARAVHCV
jgi:hypothetical protein